MAESIRYWAIRTDRDNLVFINSELSEGRLRQGWGSTPQEDLNCISDALKRNEALSDPQRLCWRGNRKLLPTEGVGKGDIIILPNLPEIGKWLIARALDDKYEYSVDPKQGDYGHIRHVELVGDKPVNPYNGKVAAPLRSTMACRSRMWNIDWASKDIDALVKSLEEGKDHSKASSESNRLDAIYFSTLTQLRQALAHNFHGKEIEPVGTEGARKSLWCRRGDD